MDNDEPKKQLLDKIIVNYCQLLFFETPKVLRVEHTIFVFVNGSSGQFAVTTSEPKSCFHTYLKILIKFNNEFNLLYGNGRGMGADLMRNRTNLIFLKSGAKVRRKADSCKHFCEKVQ